MTSRPRYVKKKKLEDIHTDISAMKTKLQNLEESVQDNSDRMLDIENTKLPGLETNEWQRSISWKMIW